MSTILRKGSLKVNLSKEAPLRSYTRVLISGLPKLNLKSQGKSTKTVNAKELERRSHRIPSTKVNSKMTSAMGSAEFYIRHSIILATGRTIDSMVGESR